MAHLSGKERSDYVREMFDRIAARYDLLNRLISGGQDLKWRRFAVAVAELPASGRLLDIATGTGDIAFEALKLSPGAQVLGADFALEMMRVGRARDPYGRRVAWTGADALAPALCQWKFRCGRFRIFDAQRGRHPRGAGRAETRAKDRRTHRDIGHVAPAGQSSKASYAAAPQDWRAAARSADRRGGGRRCFIVICRNRPKPSRRLRS